MGPTRKLPLDMPPADQQRLQRQYTATVADRLLPALTRMRNFLRDVYLPRARQTVGLSALKGGEAYYHALVEQHTTTNMPPRDIHRLGLDEVERITGGMNRVRERVGFVGPLPAFFQYLRRSTEFRPASAEALHQGYVAIGNRVAQALPRLFSAMPATRLDIRPMPADQAPTEAAARYMSGTADGKRPGVFYFNTYDLPTRSTYGMETLYLHEAVPGHHFQISLVQEAQQLPKYLRYGGNTAYNEGWALYAESLGEGLGLFADPYQRFGAYNDEMLRALRLVVDTGLHAMGWTRDQAIDYMMKHSSIDTTDATAEVERYIVMPGQALAYKIGQITISRLRQRAETMQGSGFDIRSFHDQVLRSGALPMQVLDAKIDRWLVSP